MATAESVIDPPQAASPFSFPVYRFLWTANLASSFGTLIQAIGAAWLMTSLTPSPMMVALVQSTTTLPIMLLSLLAGAIADNQNRRRVMIAAQSFMLLVSAVLVAFGFAGWLNPELLLIFTFLIGCGVAINAPSLSASISDIVPRPVVPAAVAMNSFGFNIARSAGPAIGGIVVASLGAAAAFLINTISYLPMIGVLLRWKPAYPDRGLPSEPLGAAVRAGLRYVTMSPHLRVVMIRASFFGMFASGVSALMPLTARQLLAGGASTYGLLSAAFGIGAVGGGLLTARLRDRLSAERIVGVAALALAFGSVVTGLNLSLLATLPALAIAGAGWVLGLSTFNILVQLASPRWVVGRALACYQMCAFGAMAIGSWIIGAVAAQLGVVETLLLLGVVQLVNLPFGLVLPVEEVGALDLDPIDRSFAPETQVPVSPRSGPVVIAVTYRIAPDDVPDFLVAMTEYRRIRRRDGASGWTLLRDLGDAERWVERFHVPTWIDYLRHIRRRTRDDLIHVERLHGLHRGEGLPQVSRMLERQPGLPPPDVNAVAQPPNIV
jgi:MFS family permease